MNKNETLTLWISVGSALFAVMLIYSYTQKKSAELTKNFGALTTVVVATENVSDMQTVQENMLELKEVPESFTQPGYARQMEEIIGLVALAPILKGEQVLKNKVIKPGPETGLSLQVSPGKRAVTLPTDEIRGVAHLLKPGDRVDIIVALDVGSSGISQKKYIKTLLQDVVILATGVSIVNELPRIHEEIEGDDYVYTKNLRTENKFSSVTVEVSPSHAQSLVYILSTNPSSLFMALRHPSDNTPVRLRHTEISHLLGATTRTLSSTKPKKGK